MWRVGMSPSRTCHHFCATADDDLVFTVDLSSSPPTGVLASIIGLLYRCCWTCTSSPPVCFRLQTTGILVYTVAGRALSDANWFLRLHVWCTQPSLLMATSSSPPTTFVVADQCFCLYGWWTPPPLMGIFAFTDRPPSPPPIGVFAYTVCDSAVVDGRLAFTVDHLRRPRLVFMSIRLVYAATADGSRHLHHRLASAATD